MLAYHNCTRRFSACEVEQRANHPVRKRELHLEVDSSLDHRLAMVPFGERQKSVLSEENSASDPADGQPLLG